jgi:hypothetical protein
VKLSIHIAPCRVGASEKRGDFHTWMQASHHALAHQQDGTGETYLVDLDNLYIVLLTMRELGIAPTAFRVELARRSGKQRKATTQALNRRVAAIEMALLTVNDLHSLGHFAAESDLRVIIEALLLLLSATQQELETTPHP